MKNDQSTLVTKVLGMFGPGSLAGSGKSLISSAFFLVSAMLLLARCDGDPASDPRELASESSAFHPPEVVLNERLSPILLEDGSLLGLLVDSLGPGRQGIRSLVSKDNGRSWGEPQVIYELPPAPETDAWLSLASLLDQDNRLQVFLMKWRGKDKQPRYLDVWHSRSEYPWNKWEEPKRVFEGYVGALMSTIQLNNGRIILPIHFRTDRTFRTPDKGLAGYIYMGFNSCTALYSDDEGKTFQQSPDTLSLPASTLSTYGAIEPVVIELEEGKVWMLIRTQLGRSYESFSSDGIRWSNPSPTQFICSDSPTSLTRVKDNQIVMLWNACRRYPYAFGGRHVLHGAISDNNGLTWKGSREVYRDPRRKQPAHPIQGDFGTAYSFGAPTANGKMVFSTGQGASAKTFLLDPQWLQEKSQSDDFSHGLEAWSVFGTLGVELVDHPQKESAQVLRIQRTDQEFPAGAVWNFPGGKKGSVEMPIFLEKESGGFTLSLTDHFSTPFDQEADLDALFVVPINSHKDLHFVDEVDCETGKWHQLRLTWDFETRQGQLFMDGKKAKDLPQLRTISQGVNYLRISSLETTPQEGGLLLESVFSDVDF